MRSRNVLAMVSPMSSERVNGIARYAREHGWNLMLQDRLGHHPLTWNGDGVIATIRSDVRSFRSIESLLRRGVPVVDLTINRPDVNVPRVISDHAEIGRIAARHFAEREFRHVAWFSISWGNVHRLRYRGLSECCLERPLKWVFSDERSAKSQSDWASFVSWIRDKFAAAQKPLAVLTYDETDAARLLYAARELGINVPEELAILSIGNNPLVCENQSVPLSSIDQNLERGGYEAAALLDRLMSSPRAGRSPAHPILVPPAGIVMRRSTDVIAVTDPTVRKALEFIGRNLAQAIGAPQVAVACGLKRSDLDLLFRTHLSRSVSDEIRRQRFAKVKLLLESGNLPIYEVAQQTGYCTPSHLSNAFRDTFGSTPKDWRRHQKQEDGQP